MDLIQGIEAEGLKQGVPAFRAGDRVRVHVRVVEGEKSRTQVFEGNVIGRKHGEGARATFTVRKTSGCRTSVSDPLAQRSEDRGRA
jgi:large subunit ribosomal protein L19